MNEELLSVKGAARMLGMCDATVYQMAKRGELPTVRIGRSVRIPATALAQWIRANVRNDAPSASDRGTWPDRCLQRAFVEGAQWWSLKSSGWTMWPSDRDKAEAEAVRRYGEAKEEAKKPCITG